MQIRSGSGGRVRAKMGKILFFGKCVKKISSKDRSRLWEVSPGAGEPFHSGIDFILFRLVLWIILSIFDKYSIIGA